MAFRSLPAGGKIVREFVRCQNIRAASAMATLTAIFPPDELHVIVGPDSVSPKIEITPQARALQGMAEPHLSKQLILVGHESTVAEAREMLAKLDRPREQVRLRLKVVEVSTEALRKLGVSYDFSKYSIRETASAADTGSGGGLNSLKILQLGHLPISIDATLSALETHNYSRTLAEPNLSILDGERGYILIGQKLTYPKLTGYSPAQTPIYDKEEIPVGIYVQFALDLVGNGDMILAVYPQVSTVTGYLSAGGASYPQIGTSEQHTVVRVHINETLVIGGLISEQQIKDLSEIPFLGKIPILGELFRNRTRGASKKDLVIMITPELIKQGDLGGMIVHDGGPVEAQVAPMRRDHKE